MFPALHTNSQVSLPVLDITLYFIQIILGLFCNIFIAFLLQIESPYTDGLFWRKCVQTVVHLLKIIIRPPTFFVACKLLITFCQMIFQTLMLFAFLFSKFHQAIISSKHIQSTIEIIHLVYTKLLY